MDSQFGIAHVWSQGDFVTRAVAVILLAMSIASWLVIVVKALDIVKFKKYAKKSQDLSNTKQIGFRISSSLGLSPFGFLIDHGD